jgi:hypothetical protein
MLASILDSGCLILDVASSSRRCFQGLEARATLNENPVSGIEYLFCSRFYSQIAQNTNKKSSLLFRQAALSDLTNYIKQTTAYLPGFILQATTS